MKKLIILITILVFVMTSCGKAKPVATNKNYSNTVESKKEPRTVKINYSNLYNVTSKITLPKYSFTYLNPNDNAYKKIIFANSDKVFIYDGHALILFQNKKFYKVLDTDKYNLSYFQGNKSTKFNFSQSGKYIVAGNTISMDGIYLINTESGKVIKIFGGDIDNIGIGWSPLEKYAAIWLKDNTRRVYKIYLDDMTSDEIDFPVNFINATVDDIGNIYHDGDGLYKGNKKISNDKLIGLDYNNLYSYSGKTFTIRDFSTLKIRKKYNIKYDINYYMFKDGNILLKGKDLYTENSLYNVEEDRIHKIKYGNCINFSKDIFYRKTYYFIKNDNSDKVYIVDLVTGNMKETLYPFSPIVDFYTSIAFPIGEEEDPSAVHVSINDNNSNNIITKLN